MRIERGDIMGFGYEYLVTRSLKMKKEVESCMAKEPDICICLGGNTWHHISFLGIESLYRFTYVSYLAVVLRYYATKPFQVMLTKGRILRWIELPESFDLF